MLCFCRLLEIQSVLWLWFTKTLDYSCPLVIDRATLLTSGYSMAARDGRVSSPVGKIWIFCIITGLLMFLPYSEVTFCSPLDFQLDFLSIHPVTRSADATFELMWLHLKKVGCQICLLLLAALPRSRFYFFSSTFHVCHFKHIMSNLQTSPNLMNIRCLWLKMWKEASFSVCDNKLSPRMLCSLVWALIKSVYIPVTNSVPSLAGWLFCHKICKQTQDRIPPCTRCREKK